MKKALLGFLLVSISGLSFAQQEPDEIALANNKFQLSYYEALKQKGIEKIDILVNNAGYGLISTVEDMEEKEVFDQFNINYFATIFIG